MMLVDVVMPRLSDTMEEGAVEEWHKSVGDQVNVGDDLVDIATDKAVVTMEADEAGVLAEILLERDGTATVGTPIARLQRAT